MLYRFAYYELATKDLNRKNHRINGQAISKAISLGWRSETTTVRRKFADLASIECRNHSTLHPQALQSVNKRDQWPQRRTPSLTLAPDTKMQGANLFKQNDRDPTPEMCSPHLKQPGLRLGQSNDLRPLLPDFRVISGSPAPSGISPWLLGETLYECGELMDRGLENPRPVESTLELNDHPLH